MSYQKSIRNSAVAVTSMCLLALSSAAYADQPSNTADRSSTSSKSVESKACLTALKSAPGRNGDQLSAENCRLQVFTSNTASRTATVDDVAAFRESLSASDFSSLSKAVLAGSVKSRGYYQQVSGTTSTESQTGIFYYDGNRVWVTQTYRGFTGSHRCQIERAAGVAVAPQNCYETGTNSQRTLSQQWLFTIGLSIPYLSLPISWSDTFSINVDEYGQSW